MPSQGGRPSLPPRAQAMRKLPLAMRGSSLARCSSPPLELMSGAASALVAKNGEATSCRPSSSCRMHNSTQPSPAPP